MANIAFVGLIGGLLFLVYAWEHGNGKCDRTNEIAALYDIAMQCK